MGTESEENTTVSSHPFADGPYLLSALLCERVMVEQDGVKSVFRIVDRITHAKAGPNPPETMPAFNATLFLLVKLKAGNCTGPRHLEVRLTKPGGETMSPITQSVQFEGGSDHGVDFVGTIQGRFDQEGIYWFDLFLEGIRLTRTPVRVIYFRQTQDSVPKEVIQ